MMKKGKKLTILLVLALFIIAAAAWLFYTSATTRKVQLPQNYTLVEGMTGNVSLHNPMGVTVIHGPIEKFLVSRDGIYGWLEIEDKFDEDANRYFYCNLKTGEVTFFRTLGQLNGFIGYRDNLMDGNLELEFDDIFADDNFAKANDLLFYNRVRVIKEEDNYKIVPRTPQVN